MAQVDVAELWLRVLSTIKSKINEQAFQSWFSPIKLSLIQGDSLILEVPDHFFREWLLEHYQDLINSSVEQVFGQKIKIELRVNSNILEIEKTSALDKQQKNTSVYSSDLHLNTKYTFENFVVGPSNLLAHAYCLAVAQSPAKAYNPLFIYGGVGLGKTHLMQAVGHYTAGNNKDVCICYVSSETFTNQLISAIQNRSTASFRQKYRNVDILLIDDIQFLGGKESTQEEFFHTFNTLYDAHKQIVLSSDKPPKEIPYLEERLISRFAWGLVTDIQPPDLETRVAILRKKAEKETIRVPDEVVFFLAEKIKSNIRELEGALIRVVAFACLTNKKLSKELVQEVLKDLLLEDKNRITVDFIQKKVAEYFDVRLADMKSKNRGQAVAYPRQIAMFLARQLTQHSLPEIGEFFGGRDHTTVIHAYKKISNKIKEDASIKKLVDELAAVINS